MALTGSETRDIQRALVRACRHGLTEAARYLDVHPNAIGARDGAGETALYFLAVENESAGVAFLADRGADVNARAATGSTPLHAAARLDYPGMVRLLLAREADPNAADEYGDRPLYVACKSGGTAVVTALISARADIHAQNSLRETALHEAARWGNTAAAEALLHAGADVNAVAYLGTPAWTAIGDHRDTALPMLRLLERHGARLDGQSEGGLTLIYTAACSGDLPVLRFLVEKGFDPLVPDRYGQSPRDAALVLDQMEAAAYLLSVTGS